MERDAVLATSHCDVLFCYVNRRDTMQLADLIVPAFLIPLFDVGVTIPLNRSVQVFRLSGQIRQRLDSPAGR